MSCHFGAGLAPAEVFLRRYFSGNEAQCRGVHAVTEARGLGPVREDVTQMGIAQRALHFRAQHADAEIFLLADIFFGDRLPEAWPARA